MACLALLASCKWSENKMMEETKNNVNPNGFGKGEVRILEV